MTLSPLGDSALVLTFGDEVDDEMSMRVAGAAEVIRRAAIAGVVDVVPAFATVTVYYDITHVGAFSAFEARIAAVATQSIDVKARSLPDRLVEIPVCYGGEHGPDFEAVARRAAVSLDQLIEIHSGGEYRVHAIGFVPGFGYLGGLPAKLHTPRRPTPRAQVAAGSVGIGGEQTGVYPMVTPGGWNLIGRTPLKMFDPLRTEPALLRVGDRVRFHAISSQEFIEWKSV
jgi:KipI family sensor histidine kinase inhibitor